VALETTELNPIGDVSKIIVNKKRIYILDRNKSSCIFVFSQDGKFLGKIGQKGHGSQEYIEPTVFDISGENVLVLDQFKSKLISYSPDGRYISSKCQLPIFRTENKWTKSFLKNVIFSDCFAVCYHKRI